MKKKDKMSFDKLAESFAEALEAQDKANWNAAVLIHGMVKQKSVAETLVWLAKHGHLFTVSEIEELAQIGGQLAQTVKSRDRLRQIMILRLLGHRN
jgi:hypothetical protein